MSEPNRTRAYWATASMAALIIPLAPEASAVTINSTGCSQNVCITEATTVDAGNGKPLFNYTVTNTGSNTVTGIEIPEFASGDLSQGSASAPLPFGWSFAENTTPSNQFPSSTVGPKSGTAGAYITLFANPTESFAFESVTTEAFVSQVAGIGPEGSLTFSLDSRYTTTAPANFGVLTYEGSVNPVDFSVDPVIPQGVTPPPVTTPEPATPALVASALLAMAALTRRRRT